jgi:hypothetical protein
MYYHLAVGSIPDNLTPGAHVQTGQSIGSAGSTGHSTGLHLHFVMTDQSVPFNPNATVRKCDNSATYTRGFPYILSENSVAVGFEENGNQWPLVNGASRVTLPNSWNRSGLNSHDCRPDVDAVIMYKHRDYGGECEVFGIGVDSNLADNYIGRTQ